MPRHPDERIKTDLRDALTIARYLRAANKLTPGAAPDARDEAVRNNLLRAREDAVPARLKGPHQIKAMLLHHGRRYTAKSSWTAAHEIRFNELRFDRSAQTIAYAEHRIAVRRVRRRRGTGR